MLKKRALFLDRDGVINIEKGYVYRKEDFEFVEGIFDLVKQANQRNYLVIIVTNQSGIGRGYYDEEDFNILTKWMIKEFIKNKCRIDAVYFCPHHPLFGIGKYRVDSEFRKPKPGMFLQAEKELRIDMSESIVIGDQKSDMQAGEAAKVTSLLYLKGECANCININSLRDAIGHLR